MGETLSSGISTQDAMKSVITGSTSRTVGNTDLVQLYDNNGNPNGKIAGSDLMSAVKTALGTLLNAGGAAQTTIDKVPSLNSGVLGAITTANLASVLGASSPFGISEVKAENVASGTPVTVASVTNGAVFIQFFADYFALYSYHKGDKHLTKVFASTEFENKASVSLDTDGNIVFTQTSGISVGTVKFRTMF